MKFLLISLILFYLFRQEPEEKILAIQTDQRTIICFGNSLTAGYGLDPSLAFPALLESRLKQEGKNYQVINAGLSGETSAGGLNRINWILKQKPDIFILELGGNDGLRGLPLDQTKKNLQAILDAVLAKYPEVKMVIAGMMVPPNMGDRYGNEFKGLYPELAKKNKAILIPFLLEGVGGDPDLNLADGIHPNEQGHIKVMENVYKAIFPIL